MSAAVPQNIKTFRTFSGDNLYLGIGGNRRFTTLYNGTIDDVRVWNYPIDQLELGELYATMTGEGVCVENVALDFDLDCQIEFDDFVIFASR